MYLMKNKLLKMSNSQQKSTLYKNKMNETKSGN